MMKTPLLTASTSPLDCKEIQPVHSEGDQPWDFFGRNDAFWLTQQIAIHVLTFLL